MKGMRVGAVQALQFLLPVPVVVRLVNADGDLRPILRVEAESVSILSI